MIGAILLMALNVGFFLGGGAILAVGILAIVKPDMVFRLTSILTDELGNVFSDLSVMTTIDLNDLIQKNAKILIAIGGFIFVIGFLGFCGAFRKSSTLLSAYAYIVLAILCAEIGIGVYAYMYADKFEAQLVNGLKQTLYHYQNGSRFEGSPKLVLAKRASELAWDSTQISMACCGVSGVSDWQEAKAWQRSNYFGGIAITAKVPPSCCKLKQPGIALNAIRDTDFVDIQECLESLPPGTYHDTPCYDKLKGVVFQNKTIIIAVFVVVVLVELLAIGCACWLKSKAK